MSDTTNVEQPSPARRPFQFTLRSLLVLMVVVATFFGLPMWLGFGGGLLWLLLLAVIAVYKRAWNALPFIVSLAILVVIIWPMALAAHKREQGYICSRNLRQLGYALHAYHDVHGSFPPAYVADKQGRPMHSWRVLILPYLEQETLYKKYRFDEPWDGPNNRKLAYEMPSCFHCPEQPTGSNPYQTSYVAVVGPRTAWRGDRPVKQAEILDHHSTTIMLVEIDNSGINWMEPRDITLPAKNRASTIPSGHGPGGMAMFVDSRAYYLSKDDKQIDAMLTIDGGEVIETNNP